MEYEEIRFLRMTPLRGPNIWTYRPVIEAWVDIGRLENAPSNQIPGLYQRLSTWLPGLIEHRCSVGERGGFLQRLREGTWAGHILEHVTLELQSLVGQRTGFGKARETSQSGVYKVVVRSRQEAVTRASLETARDLLMAAINDRPFDLVAALASLRALVERTCLGPSTNSIVEAASERGIPFIRLNEGNLVQLGHGARQRRIWTAETDATSAIAEGISQNKDLTKTLLASCGLPIPQGCLVGDPDEAWSAAEDLGLPVVVKPADANHARGVSLGLTSRDAVAAAFHIARRESSAVMVERCIPGIEHRLLVVGQRVVAAVRGRITEITGDGQSTVAMLIERQINSDPRCGEDESFPLEPLRLEREPVVQRELERQGYPGDSIPPAGKKILLRRYGQLADDVTDDVHPEVAEAAALAARVIGLDIAGIDLVCTDISRPLESQQGAIVEVNAGPGLLMHLKPARGPVRPVGQAIVDHLFPDALASRIPLIGITGQQGTTEAAHLIAWLLQLGGRHVGLACRDGLYLDRRQIDRQDSVHWAAGQRLLINRTLEAAVFENDAAMILGEGLAYDRCQIGIVTDSLGAETLAAFDVRDAEKLLTALRTQVDVILPQGVAILNAADAAVAGLASLCDGEVIFYGHSADLPAIVEHRARGGRALFLRDRHLLLASGAVEGPFLELPAFIRENDSCLPPTSVLAAVGAAVALGISLELIRVGLDTFQRNSGNPTSRPLTAADHSSSVETGTPSWT